MATAQTIVERALRLIGATESGETPTAGELADGLTALNDMIESWQTDRLTVFAYVDTAFTMVNGDNSYTVGPSGNFNLTPRPSKIENIFIRANNIDYPVDLVDQEKWFSIPDKTVSSDIPNKAYYEPTMSTGTLQVWPVPNAAHSLHIVTWSPVSSFASLSTSVTLPQGYARALSFNLAVEIAPEYQLAVPANVQSIALDSLAMLKRANQRPINAYTELGSMVGQSKSDIYSGGMVG